MQNDEDREDAPCDICRLTESEPSNEMVFCDMCDVCVHQSCYGVKKIPEGPWFCKPCGENIRPNCIFCPTKIGAMKKTKSGNWAHVSCALWIPEVSFGVPETLENIVNIEKIPKSRWSLLCSLCHVKGGACIQCYVKKCRTAYHVTCAFKEKLRMDMEDVEGSEQEVKFESFCSTHTSMLASGQNPHACSESSRKRKRVQEHQESDENNIGNRVPQTNGPLEDQNRPSTSYDTSISNAPAAEETIVENGNNVHNANNTSRSGAELFTEQDIRNLAAISKGTARKSFALPPKKLKTLSRILPTPNGKMARNEKGKLSGKSKRSRKSKAKSSSSKTNPPTQFAPHEEGNNPTQSQQPSSTEPQLPLTPREQNTTSTPEQNDNRKLLTESETRQELTNSNSIDPSPSASNVQQFSPSSMGPNEQHLLSNIAVGVPVNPSSSTVNDNFDDFSRYITSLLRALPFKKTLRVQKKIISLVLKEYDVSSDEELDTSSSSDE